MVTWPELIQMAETYVDHRSRGYVSDGHVFARWILSDGKQLVANLTETQKRCTELVMENRALMAQVNK
jgi:hypothetical protein